MGLTEDATRETTTGTSTTTTTSPSPVADTVREKAARVVTVTRSAAAEAAAGVQRVTAEVLATAKASVAQVSQSSRCTQACADTYMSADFECFFLEFNICSEG